MATTTNYNIPLYDSTIDGNKFFSTFVDDITGTSENSALNIIDQTMKNNEDAISQLENKGIYYVYATNGNPYIATSTTIDSYFNGLIILLNPAIGNSGPATLKINDLAIVDLKKIDSNGAKINLVNNDLPINKLVQFRYDGTDFVMIGAAIDLDTLVKKDGTTSMDSLTIGTRLGNIGLNSLTQGYAAEASGLYSSALGNNIAALGTYTHAQNEGTIAQGFSQTAIGRYNIAQGDSESFINTDNAFIIGNGVSNSERSNALSIDWQGNLNLASTGSYNINGVDIFNSTILTGIPTAPTPSAGDNSTKIATTEFVNGMSGVGGSYKYIINEYEENSATTANVDHYVTIPYNTGGYMPKKVVLYSDQVRRAGQLSDRSALSMIYIEIVKEANGSFTLFSLANLNGNISNTSTYINLGLRPSVIQNCQNIDNCFSNFKLQYIYGMYPFMAGLSDSHSSRVGYFSYNENGVNFIINNSQGQFTAMSFYGYIY